MKEKTLEDTGERIIPSKHNINFFRHLSAYKFGERYINNRNVLDVGCGTGYGTYLYAQIAKEVVGIDVSEDAISYAKGNFRRDNLKYFVADATNLNIFDDNLYDVVVSFQVIEHIEDYRQYLNEIKRVLKPGGIFLLSTPNKAKLKPLEQRPYSFHKKEFYAEEIKKVLQEYFNKLKILGQFEDKNIQELEKAKNKKDRLITLLTKLDFLRLRRIYPAVVKFKIENCISFIVKPKTIKIEHFKILEKDIEGAQNFICVCEKRP